MKALRAFRVLRPLRLVSGVPSKYILAVTFYIHHTQFIHLLNHCRSLCWHRVPWEENHRTTRVKWAWLSNPRFFRRLYSFTSYRLLLRCYTRTAENNSVYRLAKYYISRPGPWGWGIWGAIFDRPQMRRWPGADTIRVFCNSVFFYTTAILPCRLTARERLVSIYVGTPPAHSPRLI